MGRILEIGPFRAEWHTGDMNYTISRNDGPVDVMSDLDVTSFKEFADVLHYMMKGV